MNKREIKKRIYMSGNRYTGYSVHHHMPDSWLYCQVSSTKIGNAIVRALRELAYKDNQK